MRIPRLASTLFLVRTKRIRLERIHTNPREHNNKIRDEDKRPIVQFFIDPNNSQKIKQPVKFIYTINRVCLLGRAWMNEKLAHTQKRRSSATKKLIAKNGLASQFTMNYYFFFVFLFIPVFFISLWTMSFYKKPIHNNNNNDNKLTKSKIIYSINWY